MEMNDLLFTLGLLVVAFLVIRLLIPQLLALVQRYREWREAERQARRHRDAVEFQKWKSKEP